MTDTRGRYRIGVDVGGTFTDAAVFDDATGSLRYAKAPSTPADPARSVLDVLENGILLKSGSIAGRRGDPGRADMTFSIAKSYLAVLAGIALGDGLIPDIDARVAETMPGDTFASYGYLRWLNTGKRERPAAPESSYAAVGDRRQHHLDRPGPRRWHDTGAQGSPWCVDPGVA